MSALQAALADVEAGLAALAQALAEPDTAAVEAAAGALQLALARALDAGGRSAPSMALRPRLLRAGLLVAAQRDSLARANASLDRSIGLLLPRPAAGYTASGAAELPTRSGLVQA